MADQSQMEEALALLADQRRRAVIRTVVDRADPVTLDSLAETLAEEEPALVSDEDALRIDLHHTHLPRLDGAEWLQYDPETRRVEPASDVESLAGSLEDAAREIDELSTRLTGK
ncbi:DUF7344 domain-containing protein [Haloarchaeobius sp. HRN-SO-5]|uniref:DUF7344 domain-containing protein n=1 Tax=Haloarchaeobius sp. HRN-SO-5 TaxID=3446118 RepID=UPI003EBFF358